MPAILTVTPGLYPSNTGWSFPDPVTGILLRGSDFADLIRELVLYRRTNGIPAGDPELEVTEHVCRSNPMLCRQGPRKLPGSADLQMEAPAAGTPLFERALDWARRRILVARDVEPPVPDEVRRRAGVCRACRFNVKADGCMSCRAEGREMVEQLTRDLSRSTGNGLKVCSHYGWFNRAAVLIPFAPDPAAPAGCWRKPQ